MAYRDPIRVKWYHRNRYQKNKKKFERKRDNNKKYVPHKHCKECGKFMKMGEYLPNKPTPSYRNRFVASWKIRKYCSNTCLKNHYIKLRSSGYTRVQIRSDLRERLRRLQFGDYKSVSDVIIRLLKNLRGVGAFYSQKFKLDEYPCMIKVFTEEGTTSFGGKPKFSTFFLQYQKGDILGEPLRGDGSCMIIGVFSQTNGDEQNENGT